MNTSLKISWTIYLLVFKTLIKRLFLTLQKGSFSVELVEECFYFI